LSAASGVYSTSQNITVHPGNLESIAFFDNFGIKITAPVDVAAGWAYQFDVLGYDFYGNSVLVKPSFSTTNAVGTVTPTGIFTAALAYPLSGTIAADLGGLTASMAVNIVTPPTVQTPTYTPVAGVYNGSQNVTISSATAGSIICYNTAGPAACNITKTGCSMGNIYVTSVPISSSGTLDAVACMPLYLDSAVNTGLYTIMYTVGGTITGINGTVTLQNNGDDIIVSANGSFTFPTQVASGSAYNVTAIQPVGQTCTVTNGSGTVGAGSIANVGVNCVTNSYTVAGNVTGLTGTMTLQNNGGNNLSISANGAFTFVTPVLYGTNYAVTVLTQPVDQNCTVTYGTGTMPAANVPNVSVTCNSVVYGFTKAAAMTTGRYLHTATLLQNGQVLMAGGYDGGGNPTTRSELYDPTTGMFTPTGSMTTSRSYHSATLLSNGQVLFAGGNDINGITITTVELYNPATGLFTTTGSMSTARYDHTATLLPNGQVLIVGGYDPAIAGYLATAELYDPATGLFTPTGSMTSGRSYHTATLLQNGQVLIGIDSTGMPTATAEIYDPATGIFTATGLMGMARVQSTAILLQNGKVLLIGKGAKDWTAGAELYDPSTGIFTATSSMTIIRKISGTATLLPNGKVLIAGGIMGTQVICDKLKYPNGCPANTELYDPATGIFTSTGIMTTDRNNHTATLLQNGNVLIAGGRESSGRINTTAELYGVVSTSGASFTATGSMSNARAQHTSTLLQNGQVLIAGGGSAVELYNPITGVFTTTGSMSIYRSNYTATLLQNGQVLIAGGGSAIAELYDPAMGIFTATGSSMSVDRYYHTATLLPNGQVLITGGYDSATGYLATAELYDPATGIFTATGSMTYARYSHTASLLRNGQVLLTGGGSAMAELYDPVTGVFTATGSSMSIDRYSHIANLLQNGQVLITGGGSATAELYDPATGVFTATGSMATYRSNYTATLLQNGQVLIAGGYDYNKSTVGVAELYDPATGVFSTTGIMVTSRYYHTATLLTNGQVLISGGVNVQGGMKSLALNTAELYY
jgi:WD40 repeat protein